MLTYRTLLLLGCLVILTACSGKKAEEEDVLTDEQKESVEVRPEVLFAIADDKPIYQYVESRGAVQANKKTEVKVRVSGFVETSNIRSGRWVDAGDTLLTFQKDEWLFQLEQAKNQYQKALAEYRITKKLRASSNVLIETTREDSVLSDKMIRIRNGLAKAEVALKRAKLNLSYATVTAPFSGKLAADQRYTPGSYIAAGTQLGVIVDDATVRVRFDVLEGELGKIHEGMKTDVFTPDDQLLHGKVIAVSPVVNNKSKTGTVIVRVANQGGTLRTGMTVEGRIQIEMQDGKVRIPRAAILTRDNTRKLIFKLHPENNEVYWIYVKPVAVNKNWAIINDPDVQPGDTIAVGNHFALSHLQIVEPKMQLMQLEEGNRELVNQ